MPQWAGSSWYYLRFLDPHNDQALAEPSLIAHWLPVDLYIGGQEHAVLHLLYARFWHKFLYDLGIVPCEEPFKRLYHQGMILGANNEKMSKSRGNVVSPDDIVKEYGADSLRLYEMFAGPLDEAKPWSTTGLEGAYHFLERAYRLVDGEEFRAKIAEANSHELDYSYHFLVKKCSEDYESLSFNTAIAAMMVFVNDGYKAKSLYKPYLEGFDKILSCLCPFMGEEMWAKLGHDKTLAYEPWPTYDPKALEKKEASVAISINGKVRDVIAMPLEASQKEAEALAFASPKIKAYTEGKKILKAIYVAGRILNLVVA
jgi:leucyl-tRNA synthetase